MAHKGVRLEWGPLFEHLQDPAFVLDDRGLIAAMNASAGRLLGYSPSEVVGLDFHQLTEAQSAPEIRRLLGGGAERTEVRTLRLLGKTGRAFACEIDISPVRFQGDDFRGNLVVAHELGDRIRSERRSRPVLDMLVESLGGCVLTVDLNGLILTWPSNCERYFGYGREEAEGRLHLKRLFRHPTDADALLSSGSASGEFGLVLKDGTEHLNSVVLQRLLADGRHVGHTFVAHDVTGQRRDRELYESIFRHMGEAVIIADPVTRRVMDVNPIACALYGYAREEFLEISVEDFSPPGKGDASPERIEETLGRGEEFRSRKMIQRRKDGTLFPANVAVRRVRAAGRTYSFGVVRDLSELEYAEEFYRVLFQKSNDAVVLADAETLKVHEANDEACRSLGYTRDELVGMELSRLIPESLRWELGPVMESLAAGAGNQTVRSAHLRKDGSIFPVEVCITPVVLGGRRFNLGAARDLSEVERASELFRAIFESANDAILLVDREAGRFADANRRALRDLGYTRQELLKLAPEDLHPAEEYRRVQGEPGAARSVHGLHHRRKDGTLFPVEVTVSRVVFAGKGYDLIIARDVSGRREFERKLEDQRKSLMESKALLELLYESAEDQLWLVDEKGIVVRVNPKALRATGRTMESIVGRSFEEIVLPEQKENVRETFGRLFAGEPVRFRTATRDADGREMFVDVNATPLTQGDRRFVFAIVRDVTQQVRAEAELRDSEAKLRAILQSTTDAVYIKDRQSRYVLVNPAAAKMTGLTVDEMTGVRDDEVFGRESAEEIREIDRKVMETRTPVTYEGLRRVRGGERAYFTTKVPRISHDGEVIGIIGISRDVTERRRMRTERDALGRLAHRLSGITGSKNLGRILAEQARDLFRHDVFLLDLLDESTGRIRGAYAEDTREGAAGPEEVAVGDEVRPLSGDGARARTEPTLLNRKRETGKRGPGRPGFATRSARSLMFAPLKWEGRLLGVLSVQSYAPNRYGNQDLKLLEAFASQCGAALARIRTEEELRQSEERMRSLLTSMPDAVITADREGRILSVNRTLEGFLSEEAIGSSIYDHLPPKSRATARRAVATVFRSGRTAWFETPGPGIRKSPRWYETRIAPIRRAGKVEAVTLIATDISIRKQAEEALRESEDRWRSLVTHSPDIVMTVDSRHRILFINHTVAGIAPEEPIGREVFDFVIPAHHDTLRRGIDGAFTKGKHSSFETQGTGPDGRLSWYASRVGPLRRKGEIVAALLVATDVTERKQVENALKESEEKNRAIFEGAAEGILAADVRTKEFIYANPAICRMLGYSNDELLCKSVPDIHPADHLKGVLAEFEAQASGEKTLATDIPCKRSDGTVLYADIRTTNIVIGGRECNVGLFTDISERKKAEEELRFRKTLLESQSEVSIDGILVVDPEGRMISFNRRFVEMWGIPKSVVESRSDQAALKSVRDKLADPKGFLAKVRYLYRHPEEESRDEILLKDDRVFDRYSAPVRAQDGTLYGRVWFFRDVTERARARRQLQEAAAEMKRAYEDLKRTQNDLIQAEKLASLGMVMSGIAHEINNPLNVMYGNLRLLKRECGEMQGMLLDARRRPDPARMKKVAGMVSDALTAAENARRIVEEFRHFARSTGESVPADLHSCIDAAIKEVKPRCAGRIRIVRKYGRLPKLRLFTGQIIRAVQNLLKNAVESIEGRGTITIRTVRRKGFAVVEIRDTGYGIPSEHLPRIFDPFFSTKERGQGFGLGLSLCAAVAQHHHGEISAKNGSRKGAVLTMRLSLS